MSKPRCKSRKRPYRDELAAKVALARCQWKDHGEQRAYRCPLCGKWHLTSQGKKESVHGN